MRNGLKFGYQAGTHQCAVYMLKKDYMEGACFTLRNGGEKWNEVMKGQEGGMRNGGD